VPTSQPALLLAYYFLPENTSGVQRAVRFHKYLPESGYRTTVIASSHAGDECRMDRVVHAPNAETRAGWAPVRQAQAQFIQRRFLPYHEKLEWVPHAVAAAEAQLARDGVGAKDAPVVISTSPPVASHLAAYWLKGRRPIRWIADFRDPILGNPGRPKQWARPYDRWLERRIFGSADLVLAVTDRMAAMWRESYPRWAHKFHTLWNGFDPEEAIAPRAAPPRPYRVLTHAGVLYWQRHPDIVAASLDRLMEAGCIHPESFRWRFIGQVQKREDLESRPFWARLFARGVIEMDGKLLPRPAALDEIATADGLLLIDIVNTLDRAGYTVPAKIFDYLLAGRPQLALTDQDSPVDRILRQSGVPYVAVRHVDTAEQVDRKLMEFLALPSQPVRPNESFFDRFDGRRQAAALARLLDGLKP
jgi:glycosyltransferase involved in cell wall biosynthesis